MNVFHDEPSSEGRQAPFSPTAPRAATGVVHADHGCGTPRKPSPVALALCTAGLSTLLVAAPCQARDDGPASLDDLLVLSPAEQVGWGQRYEHGESVTQDVAAAVYLYCAAARAGSAEGAYRLGWLYMNGRGVARDDALAAAWLRMASAAGHEHARRALRHVDDGDSAREAECVAPVEQVTIVVAAPRSTVEPDAASARPTVQGPRPRVAAQSFPLGAPADDGPGLASAAPAAPVRGEVEAVVRGWAAAWSSQDAERYLRFYSGAFLPRGDETREQWAAMRRERVRSPAFIHIDLDRFRVTPLEPGRVQVRFEQHYRSDTYVDHVIKELLLAHEDDAWRIVREHALEDVAER